MIICSLDLSSKCSGYAIFENKKLITSGVLLANQANPIDRIKKMSTGLAKIFTDYPHIDALVVEEVLPKDDNGSKKNLHTHKILMYVQAAMVFLAHEMYPGLEIKYYYPSEWRAACGIKNGRGVFREQQKKYDIEFVQENFGLDVGDDEADAIGIGAAYILKGGA